MLEDLTDMALEALPLWGPWILMATTFLACLALPIPASLIMLAGGAFAATGDISLPGAYGGALAGAILGDQTGFFLGRGAGKVIHRRMPPALLENARLRLRRGGALAVFLSRWLFSPVGPYLNIVAGAAAYPHRAFTLCAALGEMVWVGIYIGLGVAFGANIEAAARIAGTVLMIGAALAALGWLGMKLLRYLREQAEAEGAGLIGGAGVLAARPFAGVFWRR